MIFFIEKEWQNEKYDRREGNECEMDGDIILPLSNHNAPTLLVDVVGFVFKGNDSKF